MTAVDGSGRERPHVNSKVWKVIVKFRGSIGRKKRFWLFFPGKGRSEKTDPEPLSRVALNPDKTPLQGNYHWRIIRPHGHSLAFWGKRLLRKWALKK